MLNYSISNNALDIRSLIQNSLLYFYAFSISIENIQPFGTNDFSISKLFAVFYLLSVILNIKVFFSLNKNVHFLWPIALFYVWITLISLVNINPLSSRFFAPDIFFNIVVFFAIINHARRNNELLDKAMVAFAIGTILVSILLFADIGKEVNQDCRATFFGAGLNELGLKLTTGLIIIISMLAQDSLSYGKRRFFLVIFLPLILLSIIETGSRTAYAVLIMGVGLWSFMIFINKDYKSSNIPLITLIFIFSFGLIWFFLSPCDIIASRFSNDVQVGYMNLGGRDVLWQKFFTITSENIIFGYGFSGYDRQSLQYFGYIESPHNVLIEVLLYAGLVGLIIYLLFLYRIFFAAYWLHKNMRKYMPVLLLPTFVGFALSLQCLSEKVCWLILAYAAGSYLFSKEKVKSSIYNNSAF